MEKKRHKKRTAIGKGNRSRNPAIKERLNKKCSICGRRIKAIVYSDKKYRGGHYFGKIGISSKREISRVLKLGTKKSKLGDIVVNVLKESPKPYKHLEYWECPKCYWK